MATIDIKGQGSALMDKIKALGLGGGLIFVLGFLAQLYFPWWSIAVVAFIVGVFVHGSAPNSSAYGTAAATLLWTVYAGWQSTSNGGIMSDAISGMFDGKVSGTQLIFVTGLVAGFVGGMAAMTGTLFRNLFKKELT
jgi:hypothetical protein